MRGGIDPRDLRFRPQVVGIGYKYLEGFLIGGWELILPGCGGTSALARGATLAARRLHEPQTISNHLVGWCFYTARGGIVPGVLCFRLRVVGVVEIWKLF